MIELERHIEILLLTNDCVIVPGFGGFMAHHVDARYDQEDSTYLPPLRTIGFNPQLTINDSLLAQSYLEAYDLSYPEALKRIDDDVNELRQHLETKGFYEMSDIGIIRMKEYGHYEFEPCEAGLLTPDLYGFGAFEILPVAQQPINTISSVRTNADIPAESAKKKLLSEQNSPSQDSIHIPIRVLRYVAAACIATLAFLLMPSQLGNDNNSPVMKSHIDTRILYKVMPKDITMGKPILKKEALGEVKRASASQQTTADSTHAQISSTPTQYCIVLASKISKRNAETYVKILQEKGYKSARVLQRKSGTKVIYGSYNTEGEARNTLNNLSSHSEFAEGWILKI